MTVVSVQIGAVTSGTALVATEVTSVAAVRVAVSTDPGLADPTYFGPIVPTAQFIARVSLSGLDADTTYYFAVEHAAVLDATFPGQFTTPGIEGTPYSHTVGLGGDAGLTPTTPGIGTVLASTRLSNHAIFDAIRQRAVDESWSAMVHMGDLHYYDLSSGSHGIVGGASLANFRRAWSDVLLQTNQHSLYRNVNTVYMWDDHDFLGNNSVGTLDPTGAANAAQVYRERVPHYPLAEVSGSVNHSFQIGRVLYAVLDCRYDSDSPAVPDSDTKTMLGLAQKAWLENLLETTSAKALVLVMSRQWLRTSGDDTWAAFAFERDQIIETLDNFGWLDRMAIVYADRHAFHLQTQPHQFGSMPVLTAAPFDAAGGSPLDDYPDGIPDDPGSSHSQYGTVQIVDAGTSITMTITGWRDTLVLGTYTLTINTPSPAVISSTDSIERAIAGSHQVAFEARVVTTYQDGDDPDGIEIPIIDGSVDLDGTADVQGTLDLTTNGIKMWPQRASSLLAPFGNEIFVRRGIVLDGGTLWSSLGYYRIQAPEQGDSPEGPIGITGLDRMSSIIDGRLLQPRQFSASRTLHSVFHELVEEIYPDATIIFDDDTEFETIGRDMINEDSRYDLLKEIAEAHGKVMFWDTSGILRIETAPDPFTPKWKVTGGRIGGTLINSTRSATRDGVYNAVVVTGEGAAFDETSVRGIAFDNNPTSPTYFFGRFGKVPRFYSSPLIQTETQAINAATAILQRNLGYPYMVTFTAVVNPAMRPYDPIMLLLRDGHREIHVVDALTIPLRADAAMGARTRQQNLTGIGSE